MAFVLTAAITLITMTLSVSAHYETLRILARSRRRRPGFKRTTLFVVIMGLIGAHLVEVAFFAAAFYAAVNVLHLGTFVDARSMELGDYYYYAAETYSSLGYGDIYPLGEIRLLASVTPLIGLLLLGWSGAFLFSLVENGNSGPEPPR